MSLIDERAFIVSWTDLTKDLPPFDADGARPCYRLLVQLTHGTVCEAVYWGNKEFYTLNGNIMHNVKAWMLLPRVSDDNLIQQMRDEILRLTKLVEVLTAQLEEYKDDTKKNTQESP